MTPSRMRRGYLLAQALAFTQLARSGRPITAESVEVALGCSRRTAHRWLEEWRAMARATLIAQLERCAIESESGQA